MDKLGPVAKSLGLRVPPAAPQGLVGTPLRYCLSFAIQVYHTLRGPSSAATSPARVKVEWISSNKIETRYSSCMYCAPCWGGQNSALPDPEHQLQHMLQLLFLILSHRRKTQWCSKSVVNVCLLPYVHYPLFNLMNFTIYQLKWFPAAHQLQSPVPSSCSHKPRKAFTINLSIK